MHSGYTCFCQYMCSLGIEPTTFALLTQCSTTEPQEHCVLWLCCEHLQRVCCQIEGVVSLICMCFLQLQRVELSRPHIIFFPLNYVLRSFLVITTSFLVKTTYFLVITRSFLVKTTYFLVITRSFLVKTTYFLVITTFSR